MTAAVTVLHPQRVQLSREAGWRMPPNTIKCDRTTRWGNPYRVGEPVDMKQVRRWGWVFSPGGKLIVCKDAKEAANRFGLCLAFDEAIFTFLREQLGGHNLACWCALDAPCHVDHVLRIANS